MKNSKLHISIILLLVVPFLHFASNIFGIYDKQITDGFVWIDNALHVLVGVAVGLFVIWYLEKNKPEIGFLKQKVVVIITVLFVALIWEIFEWGLLSMFVEHAKEYKIYSPNILEASMDVVSNLIGGLLVILVPFKK